MNYNKINFDSILINLNQKACNLEFLTKIL